MRALFLCGNESNHNYLIYQMVNSLKIENFAIIKCHSGLSNFEFFKNVFKKENMSSFENEYLNNFILSRNKGFLEFEKIKFENEYLSSNTKDFNEKVSTLFNENEYDCVFAYGVPIIKCDSIFKENVKSINLHFGLSQFYRGADTNIYALSKNEFEKVGLTAHKIEKKVDSGRVLFEIILTESDLLKINTVNDLNEFLLKKSVNKLIEILRSNKFLFNDIGFCDTELILDKDLNIEHIIKAEQNLREYKSK